MAYAARILQDQLEVFVNFEEPAARKRSRRCRSCLQPGAAQEGRRARALGPLGELPEERQHRLHRRPDPEDRSRDAPHPELRPQVAERDQGSARRHGPPPRHGRRRLAAGEHRRPREAVRRALLSSDRRSGAAGRESPARLTLSRCDTRRSDDPYLGTAAVKPGDSHASRISRPPVQPHGRAPQGHVRQHVPGPDQARADRHHAAEGEGSAPGRREAGHAGQARRPARPPPGDRADQGRGCSSRSSSTCSARATRSATAATPAS